MWQYIKVQFAILLSTFSWQACVFLTAACTLLTWSLLPSTGWHALAQKKAVATIEKVTAGSTTAELYGPFPGGEQETKPVTRRKIRRDDENFQGNQASKSLEVSAASDISQAGPSAIAAFKKMHAEDRSVPLSGNFGESLFSGESLRLRPKPRIVNTMMITTARTPR